MEKEIWKDVIGYENLYQCSNLGRVKSLGNGKSGNSKEKILKQKICKGYCRIQLCKDNKKKHYQVHRLIATAFLPNPQNLPQVNHKNEQKTDNCVSNLEWVTQKYNINYGLHNERSGKSRKGMKRTQETKDKMSKSQSKRILQFNREGTKILGKWESVKQVSELLNINYSSITKCCRGEQKFAGKYRWIYLEDYVNRMEKLYNLALKKVS